MRAKRSLGQNFLVDPNLQRKIVAALDPSSGDTIIEIGPGQAALTDHLADIVGNGPGRLVAVELDDELADMLADRFSARSRVDVVHADALEWEPGPLLTHGVVKVVGNIPYNITSPLIFRLLEWSPPPERIVLMVQKEVADRVLAEPGIKAYGALTVGVRAAARANRLFDVGRNAFRPVPNVDSTVLVLRPGDPLDRDLSEALRSLTRAAFGFRRKQLQKTLRTAAGYELGSDEAEAVLDEVGVRPSARPESLAPERFISLTTALMARGYPRGGGS